MKKILKCLCLLLIVPIVSVFALTGCKDKKDNSSNPETVSYSNLKTVLNSAFTQLYGTEIPAIPADVTPATTSDDSKITISDNTNLFNTVASDTDSFKSSTGKSVLAENNSLLNLDIILKIPLTVARSLVYQNCTDVFNKVMVYSFDENADFYPNQMTCKIKLTTYKNNLLIQYHSTAYGDEYESFFINIAFDSSYTATKIMYCLGNGDGADGSTPENPTEYFCFAVYDIASDTAYTLKKRCTKL